MRSYVIYFWKDHLEKHFQEEESLLFREVDDQQCLQAIQEHREIEQLIVSVRDDGASAEQRYQQLADRVERHVRFEERQLFPFLEKSIPEEQLNAIGVKLGEQHAPDCADVFADEFWK
jgi:hemerythrin-like domain-containing protein